MMSRSMFTLCLIASVLVAVGVSGQEQNKPADCYKGPPSSAQQCPKTLPKRDYKEVKGRTFTRHYGDQNNPIQCNEKQLMWLDDKGCHQYCKIGESCGGT